MFCTTTGLPQIRLNASAITRATVSVVDPAAPGTMSLTVRAGKDSSARVEVGDRDQHRNYAKNPHRFSSEVLEVIKFSEHSLADCFQEIDFGKRTRHQKFQLARQWFFYKVRLLSK